MNFNFEKLVIRTRVHTNFYRKKLPSFLHLAENDVNGFDWFKNLTSFLAMKRQKCRIFFRQKFVRTRVHITNCSKIEFD